MVLSRKHQHLGTWCKYKFGGPAQTYQIRNFGWGSQQSVLSGPSGDLNAPWRGHWTRDLNRLRMDFPAWLLPGRCSVLTTAGTQPAVLRFCDVCYRQWSLDQGHPQGCWHVEQGNSLLWGVVFYIFKCLAAFLPPLGSCCNTPSQWWWGIVSRNCQMSPTQQKFFNGKHFSKFILSLGFAKCWFSKYVFIQSSLTGWCAFTKTDFTWATDGLR